MNNKVIPIIAIIVVLVVIFTFFATVVKAEGSSLFCSDKQNLVVTLKDNADIDKAKAEISNISKVRIIKIVDRNKEWSKMVNKMDLPKMENPFKNEFTLRLNKKVDVNEIINKIKKIDFVEEVKYVSGTNCGKN